MQDGGISAGIESTCGDNHGLEKRVERLEEKIVEEDTVVLEVKAVELALDYTKHMTRFQLH